MTFEQNRPLAEIPDALPLIIADDGAGFNIGAKKGESKSGEGDTGGEVDKR
jgi:hypothetical protein